MRPFGEAQSKAMRAYAQSGQYHTIVESRVRLTFPMCRSNLSNVSEVEEELTELISKNEL